MTVQELVASLTLEEKAGLCSGADFWHTKAVERLGIPAIKVSDGPHGLRTQKEGSANPNDSIEAVCFPAGCATAASFDPALTRRMGAALGREARASGVQILLGPAVNIKRSPLCGRNFEYYSEDPYLAGELAAGFIDGVQGEGVGTSIKHFAANDQETRRLSCNSRIDERTLHEIYLPAFETAVKKAQPWTVMCSYNRVNGTYASENEFLLTDMLRNAWGFDGFVMSDWGAVNDRVKGVAAGLELEMPGSGGVNDRKLVAAVQAGTLDEAIAAERQRQVSAQLVAPEIAEKLDAGRIRRFAESEAFAKICAAEKVLRELAFITALPASAVLTAQGASAQEAAAVQDEQVLVQGIADLVLVFPDHLELLDYKTDRRKTEADFLSAYRPQLNLYALAIDKRFAPKKVTYKGIYSLELGRLIEA